MCFGWLWIVQPPNVPYTGHLLNPSPTLPADRGTDRSEEFVRYHGRSCFVDQGPIITAWRACTPLSRMRNDASTRSRVGLLLRCRSCNEALRISIDVLIAPLQDAGSPFAQSVHFQKARSLLGLKWPCDSWSQLASASLYGSAPWTVGVDDGLYSLRMIYLEDEPTPVLQFYRSSMHHSQATLGA